MPLRPCFLDLLARRPAYSGGSLNWLRGLSIGIAQNVAQHGPVLMRIEFLAAHIAVRLPLRELLDLRALPGIADNASLLPVPDNLLSHANRLGELGLCASALDGSLDSGQIGGWLVHGSFVSDYKRICSTRRETLQALLQANNTKSFV